MKRDNQRSLQKSKSVDKAYPNKMIKRQTSHSSKDQKAFVIMETKIYLFADCLHFQKISHFLNDVTESISKPTYVHTYQMTPQSLLRAKSLGYQEQKILHFMKKNMRNNQIPNQIKNLLKKHLISVECPRLYLQQDELKNAYFLQIEEKQYYDTPKRQQLEDHLMLETKKIIKKMGQDLSKSNQQSKQQQCKPLKTFYVFQVKPYEHNKVSEKFFSIPLPLSSEKIITKNNFKQQNKYDALRGKGSLHCKDLNVSLKAFTKLREYQSQALKAVVQKKEQVKAKSGYIVLPCGAGKTLLGISIMTRVKKQTLVVCSSDSGAEQWKREIQKWTQGVNRDQIVILTSKTTDEFDFKKKDKEKKAYIFVSTYSNLKAKFQAKDGIKLEHQWMKKMPWGLVIFDEAQWLPAPGNKEIANSLMAHVKIGLTATPMRQDNQIRSLIYMIGPQLYVGSWKSFVQHGYLANPKCLEIRTKMTEKFMEFYKGSEKDKQKRQICYQINPNKIKAFMYLLMHHQALNDNIIVFCDRVNLIEYLSRKLKRPLLSGDTTVEDRNFTFEKFRQGFFKTIFLTRIGDQAIDLPNANVAIELNIHKGSRKQMLQRLGRIMRPKEASSSESYNAVFYTIVSDDTLEMKYFMKRHKCLVDLGFQYDLRVFDFNMKGNLPQLMKDDPEGKQQTQRQLQEIIPDELKYWNYFQNQ